MAKSMEERTKWIGAIYAGILGANPVLKKGAFKPDLSPLCDKYDKNKDAYDALVKRKAGLTKYLTQLNETLAARNSKVDALNDQCNKIFKDNDAMVKKSKAQINGFIDQGKDADTSSVVDALTSFSSQYKELLDLDKEHNDKKEKVNAQSIVDVKKICDSYSKESKDIKTAIDKLAADTDQLEAQIRKIVLSYQKTAVEIEKPDLESSLEKVLEGFP